MKKGVFAFLLVFLLVLVVGSCISGSFAKAEQGSVLAATPSPDRADPNARYWFNLDAHGLSILMDILSAFCSAMCIYGLFTLMTKNYRNDPGYKPENEKGTKTSFICLTVFFALIPIISFFAIPAYHEYYYNQPGWSRRNLILSIVGAIIGAIVFFINKHYHQNKSSQDQPSTGNSNPANTIKPAPTPAQPVAANLSDEFNRFLSIAAAVFNEETKRFGPPSPISLNIYASCKNGDTGELRCTYDNERSGVGILLNQLGIKLKSGYSADGSYLKYSNSSVTGFRRFREARGETAESLRDPLRCSVVNNLPAMRNIRIQVVLNSDEFSFAISAN